MRRLLWAMLLIVPGCVTTEYTPITYYELDPPIENIPASEESVDLTLGVRQIIASKTYRQAIAYKDGEHAVNHYSYAQWAIEPEHSVTRALVQALRKGGRFRDAGHASNMQRPNLILTGYIERFEEVRAGDGGYALCRITVTVREVMEDHTRFAGSFEAEVPLAGNSLDDLAEAMSQAVAAVATQAAKEIQ